MEPLTLTLSVRVHAAAGWIELEDEAAGFELHADSFASRQTTQRTTETSGGDFIPGTFTNTAVPDNVTEPVAVWVTGSSTHDYRTKMKTLKAAFSQVTYQMTMAVGDAQETWTCFASDFTEETQQAYMFATCGVLRVQVRHLPDTTLASV